MKLMNVLWKVIFQITEVKRRMWDKDIKLALWRSRIMTNLVPRNEFSSFYDGISYLGKSVMSHDERAKHSEEVARARYKAHKRSFS